MEIQIIKRETTGSGGDHYFYLYLLLHNQQIDNYFFSKIAQVFFPFPGPNTFNENETLAKYEIMDGAPVRGL